MGLGAVGAAFREAHRLGDKHAAARLLVWMAFQVLDEPKGDMPAMTFWGGFQTAAIGLGYGLADREHPTTRAALTAVKRTMRVLEEHGLIERTRYAAAGRTASWLLTLDPILIVQKPVDRGVNNERLPVSLTGRRSERGGRTATSKGVEDRPPMEVEDRPVQGSKTDLSTGRTPTPLSNRPNSPDGPEPIERATREKEPRMPAANFDPFDEPFAPEPVSGWLR